MIPKEKILSYKPDQISFDEENLLVNGEKYPCKNPRLEFARALSHFAKEFDRNFMMSNTGNCYYGANTWIANNTVFGNDRSSKRGRFQIGYQCIIGDAGFGFEKDEEGNLIQIPHLGRVWIQDRVVLRNHVMIDRAVIGETVIGEGTVIDNLVHVAHGVKIGKNCLIVAGSVLGGSCEIGDGCFIGINASVKNKVKIGNNVTVGMGAVITKDVPDGVTVIGINKIL